MKDRIRTKKELTFADITKNYGPIFTLLLVVLVFGVITKGKLFSKMIMKNTFDQCYQFIIGGFGAAFLFSQGAIDLSLGSVIALSAICGAYSSQQGALPALLVCLAVGLSIGLINGIIHSELQIMVFVQGLSMSFLIKGFLYILTHRQTYIKIPATMKSQYNNYTVKLSVMILFIIIITYLFNYTSLGKQSRSVGAGETAALQSGVNVKFLKRFAFLVSGLSAGIIAFLILIKTGNGGPTSGQGYEFSIMVALVLGGMPMEGGAKSNLRACIIGPLTVAVMNSGMSLAGFDSRTQEIVTGIVFILVLSINSKLTTLTASKKQIHT